MLKKIDIYVLKNFMTLFLGTFVICIFILMMQFLWKYVDDLVGKGLEMSVLAQFFFYAGETLVSLALPLAILLASLISFGNMGERLELLAMKAAGIPLIRILQPIAIFMVIMAGISYYFQDYAAPHAQRMVYQMLFSVRQTSPTIDIPEGVFYDGIDGVNLYVKEKNPETDMLYEVIIYELSEGASNAHIILADSALLETSADKQHLLLHLYSGEQFENVRTNAMVTNNVPYRRETFVDKHFIIDFNTDFSMTDNDFSNNAKTKKMGNLIEDIDSLKVLVDSTALAYYDDMKRGTLHVSGFTKQRFNFTHGRNEAFENPHRLDRLAIRTAREQKTDSTTAAAKVEWIPISLGVSQERKEKQEADSIYQEKEKECEQLTQRRDSIRRVDTDSLFQAINEHKQANTVHTALQKVSLAAGDMEFRTEMMNALKRDLRMHEIQIWQNIFLFYYIVNSFGSNLATSGAIPTWLGMWFSTIVLAPIAYYLTMKSNNDSVVFNIDTYRNFFWKLFGIKTKRNVFRKEVIINDPDYESLKVRVERLTQNAKAYRSTRHLNRFPNYVKVFFKNGRDEEIENISNEMEFCVEQLSNSKDRQILKYLNGFPVIDTYAHTAPFKDGKIISQLCGKIVEKQKTETK